MIIIEIKPGESLERAIKKLKRKWDKNRCQDYTKYQNKARLE